MKTIKSLLCFFLIMTVTYSFFYIQGYRLNTSHSYPFGIYKLTYPTAFTTYHKGDLVLFCPPDNAQVKIGISRGYIDKGRCEAGSVPIIKRIAATFPDNVTLTPHLFIKINGYPLSQTEIFTHDSANRPLTPATLDGQTTFTVPKDTVFLYSDYAPVQSFDSRYFGVVPLKNIQGRIHPIWVQARRGYQFPP